MKDTQCSIYLYITTTYHLINVLHLLLFDNSFHIMFSSYFKHLIYNHIILSLFKGSSQSCTPVTQTCISLDASQGQILTPRPCNVMTSLTKPKAKPAINDMGKEATDSKGVSSVINNSNNNNNINRSNDSNLSPPKITATFPAWNKIQSRRNSRRRSSPTNIQIIPEITTDAVSQTVNDYRALNSRITPASQHHPEETFAQHQEYFIRALTTLAINNLTRPNRHQNDGSPQQSKLQRRRASHYDRNIQLLLGSNGREETKSTPNFRGYGFGWNYSRNDSKAQTQEMIRGDSENIGRIMRDNEYLLKLNNRPAWESSLASSSTTSSSSEEEVNSVDNENYAEQLERKKNTKNKIGGRRVYTEQERREKINRLRNHLKCSGLGEACLVTVCTDETETAKRDMVRLVRKVHRGLSPEKRERLRLKTHLEYEMSLMKGESFCEEQDQVGICNATTCIISLMPNLCLKDLINIIIVIITVVDN